MIGDRKRSRGERAAALNKIENVMPEDLWETLEETFVSLWVCAEVE